MRIRCSDLQAEDQVNQTTTETCRKEDIKIGTVSQKDERVEAESAVSDLKMRSLVDL